MQEHAVPWEVVLGHWITVSIATLVQYLFKEVLLKSREHVGSTLDQVIEELITYPSRRVALHGNPLV